jgi:uncharacterized protein YceK
MTRMRTTAAALMLAATGLMISGCAGVDTTSQPAPAASTENAPAPATSTEAVPAGWITGTITLGGEGPCYGLKADDGTAYAMHSDNPRPLKTGDKVKVQVTASLLRMSCGDGTQVQIKALEPVK